MTDANASGGRIYVFLDTTVLIHGVPIEQLDWATRFNADEVVLVLATTVMAELDKLKDGADGRFSRDRARDFFARFQKYETGVLEPPGAAVRERVWLRVLTDEPKLFDGADPSVNDDRIVSAVLEFETEPRAAKLLFARDTNIILKARRKKLRAERLPEDCEVQPEAEPVEKRLRATEKELADLKNRRPKISLLLVHGDQQHAQHVEVVMEIRSSTDGHIEAAYAAEEARCRSHSRRQLRGLLAMAPTEDQVTAHLARFREYLESAGLVAEALGRRIKLGFVLSNEGAAVASKIELDVTVDGELHFAEVGDRPRLPRKPKLRSPFENILATSYANHGVFAGNFSVEHAFRGLHLEPDQLDYSLKDVMHGDSRVLTEFDVVLPDDWSAQGFNLEVALRVAELPKLERLTFNVRTRFEPRRYLQTLIEEGEV